MSNYVEAAVETWTIPTYVVPPSEEMPMFAEHRQHQGTSGNPYPNRVTQKVERERRVDKEYEVVRLENDYIRVVIIPSLGGRIFEAYDKVNAYHFLYRQHSIKPALIGAFGSWISGGIEFNWPYHHRPSTFMPVDFTIERPDDESAICWLSECDPFDRTRGTVGIVLRKDASFFETRVRVYNRTPLARSFLWWENAAVSVNKQYRLVFPPDVTWVHHHYDRNHTTYPIAQGRYGSVEFAEPTDISWHRNTPESCSYFSAPSQFDFCGGYDYSVDCGILHIANHHISPGKKMFTWGYNRLAESWERALTDADGPYCELMAGSYTDDQPDFSWLAPYETKCFSQYWYPTRLLGGATYANLDAAVSVEKNGAGSKVRLNVTRAIDGATLRVFDGAKTALETPVSLNPCACFECAVCLSDDLYTVELTDGQGKVLLRYKEIIPDFIHIPKDNPGIPTPNALKTAQELYIAGLHIDQYRDPIYKPDQYYCEALRYEPDHLPSLTALGEYLYRTGKYQEALDVLHRALSVQNTYNLNPKDGTISYLIGLCNLAAGKDDKAYDCFYKACWSYPSIAAAMTQLAALDGRRRDWASMYAHACEALAKEDRNTIAGVYKVCALWKNGKIAEAKNALEGILAANPLDSLALWIDVLINGKKAEDFFSALRSNPSQTGMDIAFDLARAGLYEEAASVLRELDRYDRLSTMALYTLAYILEKTGHKAEAGAARSKASANAIVDVFPYRLDEIAVLEAACRADAKDGTAAYLLGCVLYDKKQFAMAVDCWKHAVDVSPDFYIPYRNLAVAYFSHLGDRELALRYQKQAVELNPTDEQLLNEAAYLMAALGVPGEECARYIAAHMPDGCGDDLYLELARAHIRAGQYREATKVMLSHSFTPGEGGEFAIAEVYMFSKLAEGRKQLKHGNLGDAAKCFEEALHLPENLHSGFWNMSVTIPYKYYLALALMRLGREDEGRSVVEETLCYDNSGMWNMGGEFVYYYALLLRLAGRESEAMKVMREAILRWEALLADKRNPGEVRRSNRFFYLSFIEDRYVAKEAELHYMLGLGMLFVGDKERAKTHFASCLEMHPDNAGCILEMRMLE
ncbi:MAG: DUF5107 domain-containing protein [Christensenellales bacterium]|jgi:tetratricopeptide (TPR) repeat protein